MPTIKNLVLDSKLAQATYTSNNRADSASVDGWQPLSVKLTDPLPPDSFGAQLYKGPNGQYKLAFRGTETNFADWAQNGIWLANQWSDEWGAAARFTAASIALIAQLEDVPIEQAKQFLSTTGHSQGGFLSELSARLFGLSGSSLDGMGSNGIYSAFHSRISNYITTEYGQSVQALNYSLPNEVFTTRIYTGVGRLGVHSGDVSYARSAKIQIGLALVTTIFGAAVIFGSGLSNHPIGGIVAKA